MNSQDSSTALIRDLRRIRVPEGIEQDIEVRLGGEVQSISLRGRDRNNPVLLMLHGGPGWPLLPHAWAFQSPWEDFFTVVHWDQRGCGKNRQSKLTSVEGQGGLSGLTDDAKALVHHLCGLLGKQRIVVLGHSWGSVIAMRLAHEIPELLHAVVSVGQVVRGNESDVLVPALLKRAELAEYRKLLGEARRLTGQALTPSTLLALHRLALRMDGGWYGWSSMHLYYALPTLSPDYSSNDLESWMSAAEQVLRLMSDEMLAINLYEQPKVLKTPLVMMLGVHDLIAPFESARRYFEWIEAPSKRLVSLERSAHFPMLEQPGIFLQALVSEVLPLTRD